MTTEEVMTPIGGKNIIFWGMGVENQGGRQGVAICDTSWDKKFQIFWAGD
jgi:hypothetical protein